MRHAAIASKTTGPSEHSTESPSAGRDAVAIAPPRYGIDFVDRASKPLFGVPAARSGVITTIQRAHAHPVVQAKLTVNQPGDVYEQEADRVADQVMRMPDAVSDALASPGTDITTLPIQRKCRECEDEMKLQRHPNDEANPPAPLGQYLQRLSPPWGQETNRNLRRTVTPRIEHRHAAGEARLQRQSAGESHSGQGRPPVPVSPAALPGQNHRSSKEKAEEALKKLGEGLAKRILSDAGQIPGFHEIYTALESAFKSPVGTVLSGLGVTAIAATSIVKNEMDRQAQEAPASSPASETQFGLKFGFDITQGLSDFEFTFPIIGTLPPSISSGQTPPPSFPSSPVAFGEDPISRRLRQAQLQEFINFWVHSQMDSIWRPPAQGHHQGKIEVKGPLPPTLVTPLFKKKPSAPAATSDALPVSSSTESAIHAMKGSGRPLDQRTRSFMEPRFGVDFGEVRIHTDATASRTAQSLNARAFTIGHDIAFNHGEYNPASATGKQLLAHELTHTIQQSTRPCGAVLQRAPANKPPRLKPLEAIAQRIAKLALGPAQAKVQGRLGSPRGPVLSVARNKQTGKIYVGLNNGIPTDFADAIEKAINKHKARVAAGDLKVVRTDPAAVAGGHSEVKAVNAAVRDHEKSIGRKLKPAELPKLFEYHNVWLKGKRRLTAASPCEHCQGILRNVPVTNSTFAAKFVAEGGVRGEITVPQRGEVRPSGGGPTRYRTTVSGEVNVPQRGEVRPSGGGPTRYRTTVSGEIRSPGIKSRGLRMGGNIALTALFIVGFWWLDKRAAAKERKKRARLWAKNVEPEINKILNNQSDKAVRLTTEDPYKPVYANITIVNDYHYSESGIAANKTSETVTDISTFVGDADNPTEDQETKDTPTC